MPHLGNNDLLLQDLHCIISSTGLLFHQDHLPEGAFAQQLQIVEVVHCLTEQETDVRKLCDGVLILDPQERDEPRASHLSFMVADGGVHLLLIDDLDLGGGAAQDSFLLLLGQLVRHHLDGFYPFVPVIMATDIQIFFFMMFWTGNET